MAIITLFWKDQIGLSLWPDASPAQVRNSFHVTLHHSVCDGWSIAVMLQDVGALYRAAGGGWNRDNSNASVMTNASNP